MNFITLKREGAMLDGNLADALLTRRGADLIDAHFSDALISSHDGGRTLIARLPPHRIMEGVFARPELWRVLELATGPKSVALHVERWDGAQWRQFYFSPEPDSSAPVERVCVLVDCLRVAGMIGVDEE